MTIFLFKSTKQSNTTKSSNSKNISARRLHKPVILIISGFKDEKDDVTEYKNGLDPFLAL